jgi:hypothetical protein
MSVSCVCNFNFSSVNSAVRVTFQLSAEACRRSDSAFKASTVHASLKYPMAPAARSARSFPCFSRKAALLAMSPALRFSSIPVAPSIGLAHRSCGL